MHRLKISPSMECPCGTGTQDPEHILQECPTYTIERTRSWPIPMNFRDKLWGAKCELINTTVHQEERKKGRKYFSERGNALPPHGLVFPINSTIFYVHHVHRRYSTYGIAHTKAFVTPVMEHWLE